MRRLLDSTTWQDNNAEIGSQKPEVGGRTGRACDPPGRPFRPPTSGLCSREPQSARLCGPWNPLFDDGLCRKAV